MAPLKPPAPDVFGYSDYKAYLAAWIEAQSGRRGTQAGLAKAAGCGASFLSQVLKGHQHLSSEQILGIAAYVRLNALETDYLVELLQLARAGNARSRKFFQDRLGRIVRKNFLDTQPDVKALDVQRATLLASSWLHSALRMLASMREFGNVDAMARRLSVPPSVVIAVLKDLEGAGLLERLPSGGWKSTVGPVYFEPDSPQSKQFNAQWMALAQHRATFPSTEVGHAAIFARLISLNPKTLIEVQDAHTAFKKRLDAVGSDSGPDGAEGRDLYCVLARVFRV
ncbi:MAG TPA: TIGR02147 family protein [Bdellovibrionota bacterium]|nr:TIGR02147 family protein [Bdellovibrionota bacterium]